MGLLKDDRYWANVANEVFKLRPGPGIGMPAENAVQILELACKALSDLLADPAFLNDLQAAIEVARRTETPLGPNEFSSFVDEFVRAEEDVLKNSSVDFDTTGKILAEARELATSLTENDIDRLPQKIDLCRRLACENRTGISPEEQKSRALVMVSVVGGVTLISADLGIIAKSAVMPPAAGALAKVAGQSISSGIKMVGKAIWNRW